MFHYTKRLVLFLFLLASFAGFSQTQQKLTIVFQDSISDKKLLKQLNYKYSFETQAERDAEMKRVFFVLRQKGYLAASLDSFQKDSFQLNLFISIGKVYKWAALKKGNVTEEILSAIGFREKFYFEHTFTPVETARLLKQIVVYEENNGHPFATVKLDSVSFNDISINFQPDFIILSVKTNHSSKLAEVRAFSHRKNITVCNCSEYSFNFCVLREIDIQNLTVCDFSFVIVIMHDDIPAANFFLINSLFNDITKRIIADDADHEWSISRAE